MTGHVEPEAGAPRPWRGGRPLLIMLLVLAAALTSIGASWFGTARTEPAVEGPGTSTMEGSSAPEGSVPEGARRSAGPTSTAPLPPIPGTTVDAVAAGWARRWNTQPKPSARGYDTTAVLPGTNYRTRFVVIKSPDGGGTEIATLICTTKGPRVIVDQRLIRAVVEFCLAPALRGEEKTALSNWISEQDYSRDVDPDRGPSVYANRGFARFNAEVLFAGNLFHVGLFSKGQPAPGAISTTGAQPAG